MKVYYLLPFILLLVSCGARKNRINKDLKSGIIQYNITMDLTEEAKGMEEVFGDQSTITFNEHYLRLQKNSNVPADEFQIKELETGIERNYLEFKGNKYVIIIPPESIPPIGTFTYHDEYKMVAGFQCQKATATMGEDELVVYFTKSFGVNFCPYVDLDGFALEYTLSMPYGKVTYSAQTVQLQRVDANVVSLPAGYKEVTPMELQQEMMGQAEPIDSGEPVIDFEKSDLDGNVISSLALRGKVVVANFWFTTCRPCQIEMPYLNDLKESYSGKNVEFIGITYEKEEEINKFLEKNKFDFIIIPDSHDLVKSFDIFAYPTTVIMDRYGKVVDFKIGGSSKIKEELSVIIEKALKI